MIQYQVAHWELWSYASSCKFGCCINSHKITPFLYNRSLNSHVFYELYCIMPLCYDETLCVLCQCKSWQCDLWPVSGLHSDQATDDDRFLHGLIRSRSCLDLHLGCCSCHILACDWSWNFFGANEVTCYGSRQLLMDFVLYSNVHKNATIWSRVVLFEFYLKFWNTACQYWFSS